MRIGRMMRNVNKKIGPQRVTGLLRKRGARERAAGGNLMNRMQPPGADKMPGASAAQKLI